MNGYRKTTVIVFILSFCFIFSSVNVLAGKSPEKQVLKEARKLYKAKEFQKAIDVLDKGIKEHGESESLMGAKHTMYLEMNRLDDAYKAAVRRSELAKRKSPWHCMYVVSICLKQKKTDLAFKWLNKAVKRGFLSYSAFDEDEFKALKKDPRIKDITKKIKDNIGIGKPAKDFSIKLMDGKTFTLAGQKGKVLLIDFWATWCPPCREGIPGLKKFYAKYKDRNFEILGISLDDKAKTAAKYIQKHEMNWLHAATSNGWMDPTARFYNVHSIPSYWLIDKKGILRDFGYHLRDKETLKQAIEKLLKEK